VVVDQFSTICSGPGESRLVRLPLVLQGNCPEVTLNRGFFDPELIMGFDVLLRSQYIAVVVDTKLLLQHKNHLFSFVRQKLSNR